MHSCPLLGVRGAGTRPFLGYPVPWVLRSLTYTCAHRLVYFIGISRWLTVPGTVGCCVSCCQCGKFRFPRLGLSGLFPSVFSLTWRTWGCRGLTALTHAWPRAASQWVSVDGPPGPLGSLPCDDSVGPCRLPCPPLLVVSAVLPPCGFKQPFPVIMRLHIFLYIYRPFGFAVLWSAGIFILVFKNLFIDTGPLLVIYFATFFSHFVVQFYWHSGFSFFLSFEWREVLFTFIFWPHHMTCGILVPRPGLEPRPLALKSQSPNYWTAGKVLRHS